MVTEKKTLFYIKSNFCDLWPIIKKLVFVREHISKPATELQLRSQIIITYYVINCYKNILNKKQLIVFFKVAGVLWLAYWCAPLQILIFYHIGNVMNSMHEKCLSHGRVKPKTMKLAFVASPLSTHHKVVRLVESE
jgi:hypothetical protein